MKYLRARFTALITWAVLFSACGGPNVKRPSLDAEEYPYHFVEDHASIGSAVEREVRVIDLDGDRIDEEILVSFGQNSLEDILLVQSRSLPQTFQLSLTRKNVRRIGLIGAWDVSGDTRKDIFVFIDNGDSILLQVVDVFEDRIATSFPFFIVPESVRVRKGEVNVEVLDVLKIGDDHHLLCTYTSRNAELNHRPTGVGAVRYSTGERLWYVPTVSFPTSVRTHDIDGDAIPEIFISTDGDGGGEKESNGLSGSVAYLFGVNHEGQKLFPPVALGRQLNSSILGFRPGRDGTKEIICITAHRERVGAPVSVRRISASNGRVIEEKSLPAFTGTIGSAELAVHGDAVVYPVLSGPARLTIFDTSFSPLVSAEFDRQINSIGLRDLVGDRNEDILVNFDPDHVAVLNENLEPLLLMNGTNVYSTLDEQTGNRRAVINSGKMIRHGAIVPNPSYGTNVWRERIVPGLLIAVLTIALGLLLYRALFYSRLFQALSHRSPTEGTMVLNRRGRVVAINGPLIGMLHPGRESVKGVPAAVLFHGDRFGEIASLLGASLADGQRREGRLVIESDGHPRDIDVRVQPLHAGRLRLGTLIIAEDISEILKSDRAINWALVAQNLAHEMKTPLSTIWFTLERIRQITAQRADGEETHLKSIEEEIRRLDRYVKGFMKLAHLNPPNLQPTSINHALDDLLEGLCSSLPGSVELEKQFDGGLPDVRLDVNLFTVGVRNILDNAVTAMQGKGKLRVSTYLVQNVQESWVALAVADTGRGLSEADKARVFSPYFSKSDGGTGLGLLITKKIVDDHGGDIQFSSTEGLGTEFVIRLPVPNHAGGSVHG